MLLAPGAFPGGRGQRAHASLLGQGRVGNQGTRRLPSPSSSLVTPPCARHASLSSSRLRNRRGSPRLSRARFSRPPQRPPVQRWVPRPPPVLLWAPDACSHHRSPQVPGRRLGSARFARWSASLLLRPLSPCLRRLPSRARDAVSGFIVSLPCPVSSRPRRSECPVHVFALPGAP